MVVDFRGISGVLSSYSDAMCVILVCPRASVAYWGITAECTGAAEDLIRSSYMVFWPGLQ